MIQLAVFALVVIMATIAHTARHLKRREHAPPALARLFDQNGKLVGVLLLVMLGAALVLSAAPLWVALLR